MSRCLAPLSVADRRGTGMARSRTLLTGRWRRTAAVATILSVLVLGSQPLVSQGSTAVPTGFAAASVSSRADSLLRRMTLAEKVGQMDQIVIGKLKAASAPDNGWGRYFETLAEQPALSAAIGGANIRGMQGGGFHAPQVAATVKHFAGYSGAINGHDRVKAQLPIRYLQDQFLPSYAGGIDAGAATVMVDSGSLNGVPATASRFLLTEELRNRLGFKGVVISDYGDVPALQSAYHVAADLEHAVAQAVNAGIDVSMTPMDSAGW